MTSLVDANKVMNFNTCKKTHTWTQLERQSIDGWLVLICVSVWQLEAGQIRNAVHFHREKSWSRREERTRKKKTPNRGHAPFPATHHAASQAVCMSAQHRQAIRRMLHVVKGNGVYQNRQFNTPLTPRQDWSRAASCCFFSSVVD